MRARWGGGVVVGMEKCQARADHDANSVDRWEESEKLKKY